MKTRPWNLTSTPMKTDRFDIRRHGDTLWTLFSMSVVIAVAFFLAQHFWIAEREYKRCMEKAGRDFWKQQDCRNAQAPAR